MQIVIIVVDAVISIHALLAESDTELLAACTAIASISIHALLAESDRRASRQQPAGEISIHALLAESDHSRRSRKQHHPHFYPRSPCGERPNGYLSPVNDFSFLSTLSLRRATHFPCTELYQQRYFYPRSPCGERR